MGEQTRAGSRVCLFKASGAKYLGAPTGSHAADACDDKPVALTPHTATDFSKLQMQQLRSDLTRTFLVFRSLRKEISKN